MRPLVVSMRNGRLHAAAVKGLSKPEIRAEAPRIEQAIRACGAKVE